MQAALHKGYPTKNSLLDGQVGYLKQLISGCGDLPTCGGLMVVLMRK